MYELLGDENCERNASKTNLVHSELNLGREEVAEASKSAASEISVLIETGFSGLISCRGSKFIGTYQGLRIASPFNRVVFHNACI